MEKEDMSTRAVRLPCVPRALEEWGISDTGWFSLVYRCSLRNVPEHIVRSRDRINVHLTVVALHVDEGGRGIQGCGGDSVKIVERKARLWPVCGFPAQPLMFDGCEGGTFEWMMMVGTSWKHSTLEKNVDLSRKNSRVGATTVVCMRLGDHRCPTAKRVLLWVYVFVGHRMARLSERLNRKAATPKVGQRAPPKRF